jgi:hypothetical protein
LFTKFYLYKKTAHPLIVGLQEVLITNHSKTILERGFAEMMNSKKADWIESLILLYQFFNEVDLVDDLKKQWIQFIKEDGLNSLKHYETDKVYTMKSLLMLKELTDKVVVQCFENREDFKIE